MFPMWFFVLLIFVICYLLVITRPSDESLVVTSRNKIRRINLWLRGSRS